MSYVFPINKLQLSESERNFRYGYYKTSTANGMISIFVSLSYIYLYDACYNNNIDATNNTKISVYYR